MHTMMQLSSNLSKLMMSGNSQPVPGILALLPKSIGAGSKDLLTAPQRCKAKKRPQRQTSGTDTRIFPTKIGTCFLYPLLVAMATTAAAAPAMTAAIASAASAPASAAASTITAPVAAAITMRWPADGRGLTFNAVKVGFAFAVGIL